MSRYLLINLIIIIFPLLLSFEKQVRFYRRMPALAVSFFAVGIPFIVWDILAASRGDWAFNSAYVGRTMLFGLPLEEVIFFPVVLYATMFTYEVLRHYIFEKKINVRREFFYVLSAVLFSAGIIFVKVPYTSTVLLVSAFAAFMSGKCFYGLVSTVYYLLFITVTLILFFAFNMILTGLPVVIYSENAILGVRAWTIPAEDFLYNYSMLTLYLGVYWLYSEKREKSEKKYQLSHNLGGGD